MRCPRFISQLTNQVLFALVALATVHSTAIAETAPYEARVVATGASVHSGPGEKFYPTDTLAQGDVVEVYREKPGGWLAIRPPVNSFSWVTGSNLKLRDGGLAEITKDDVASRIGSRLSDKHNAAQVRLKKGEVVEVIDEERIDDETWYKISPPAGEFRWIQASLVERVSKIERVSAEEITPISATTTETKGDATTALAEAPPLISNSSAPTATASPFTAAAQPPTPTAEKALAVPAPTAPAPAEPAARTAGPVADDLSRELAAIELRLSRMVAAPVNLWNTERLERDALQLLSRAQTTADRDAVQVTLNKIKQFAVIGQRSSQIPATVLAQNGLASPATAPAASAPGMATPTAPGAPLVAGIAATNPAAAAPGGTSPYDAVGILRPVVSRRPGAPQFALVDERGQVLSFITPTPDMNLQAYLGRRVGVVGNRGFIAEFNRSHVTAARVTPLSDRIVR
jgi:hypothetical protein